MLLLALAVWLAAGCAASPCAGPPVRVQLLLVNDVYQLVPDTEGRGGLARVATVVRALRRETPNTLFALGGDTLSPSLHSTFFQGRQMVEAWNAVGLDVAAVGNHEFDFGPGVLRERMAESRFLWLAANVRERGTGAPFGGARPFLVREWGPVRVVLVGLTVPATAHTSNAGPDVVFDPVLPAARAAFERAGAAHLRVAVTHLTIAEDRELAAALPLHAILGGHDHDPMVHTEGETIIVKAGSDALNVGRVEYELGCGGAVLGRRHRLIPVDASIAPAPDVDDLVARFVRLADRELDVRVADLARPLDVRDSEVRGRQTQIGGFLAGVMRERMDAQVGLLNGGGIRANRLIPAGPLTRRDVRAMLPFANTLVLVEVSGAALRGALERSVSVLPRPAGAFLQTAGVEYRMDVGQPPGQRIAEVSVGGRPVEPEARYRVAMPDFLARGGDGYAMFAQGRMLVGPEDGPGLIDAVLEALGRGRSP